MRQDKDRSGKWLIDHHGDAILKLCGITGFTTWKAVMSETVAPRRLPDGLIEVRFPNQTDPTLILVEIETYPGNDVDSQVLDDLMLIAVDKKVVPEVVSLVLKPKGNLTVSGTAAVTSRSGRVRLSGSWSVIRLWELDAETLFSAGDPGLIPWVPLTKTTLSADELMTRCRDRLAQVPKPSDRAGLMAVTQLLAGLAFPDRRFLNLFGGAKAMIESPVYDEMVGLIRQYLEAEMKEKLEVEMREKAQHLEAEMREKAQHLEAEMREKLEVEMKEKVQAEEREKVARVRLSALREAVGANLETRFGPIPAERLAALAEVTDEAKLQTLLRLAITCPDVDSFVAGLAAGV